MAAPVRRPTGRPPKRPIPSAASTAVRALFGGEGAPAWTAIAWRTGSKGPLAAKFAALRVRGAGGPADRSARHPPGEAAWLVGGERASGARKYDLANRPPDVPLATLAAAIKARRVCGRARRRLKRELGLGRYEGRGGLGLRRHLALAQLALAFLQHLRLRGKNRVGAGAGPPPRPSPPALRRHLLARLGEVLLTCCPCCRHRFPFHPRE